MPPLGNDLVTNQADPPAVELPATDRPPVVLRTRHLQVARTLLATASGLALVLAVSLIAGDAPPPTRAGLAAPFASGPVLDPAGPPVSLSAAVPMPDATAPAPASASVPSVTRTGLALAAVTAAEAAASARAELAVAVLDRETGEMASGGRGAEPYFAASLSKVVVAVDVLNRRRLEGLPVPDADIALLQRALGPSDDAAMSALWSRFDGPGAAGRMTTRLGLTGTTAPRDPSQWGEMSVPAVDMVRIWQYVLDEVPAVDRDLLISAMAAAPALARDGFDQGFGLLSPAVDGSDGAQAVAKQGWMCCIAGRYYLHSSGAVGADQRFVVTLLSRPPRAAGWGSARQELDVVATAAAQATR